MGLGLMVSKVVHVPDQGPGLHVGRERRYWGFSSPKLGDEL